MGGGSRSWGTPHHRLLASPLYSQRLNQALAQGTGQRAQGRWAQGSGSGGAQPQAAGAPHQPSLGGDASPLDLGISRADGHGRMGAAVVAGP